METCLKDDESITEVRVEIVDLWVDSKRIDPVSVHFLFSGLLNGIEFLNNILLGWIKSRVVVKKICHKGKIKPFLTLDNILGCDKGSAFNLFSLLKHIFSSFQKIFFVHCILIYTSLFGSNLVDQLSINLTVFDVIMKISDSSV